MRHSGSLHPVLCTCALPLGRRGPASDAAPRSVEGGLWADVAGRTCTGPTGSVSLLGALDCWCPQSLGSVPVCPLHLVLCRSVWPTETRDSHPRALRNVPRACRLVEFWGSHGVQSRTPHSHLCRPVPADPHSCGLRWPHPSICWTVTLSAAGSRLQMRRPRPREEQSLWQGRTAGIHLDWTTLEPSPRAAAGASLDSQPLPFF